MRTKNENSRDKFVEKEEALLVSHGGKYMYRRDEEKGRREETVNGDSQRDLKVIIFLRYRFEDTRVINRALHPTRAVESTRRGGKKRRRRKKRERKEERK